MCELCMSQVGLEQSVGTKSVQSNIAVLAGFICVTEQAYTLLTNLCFGFLRMDLLLVLAV